MYRLNIDAYCIKDETADMLRRASSDIALVRSTVNVRMGGAEAMVSDHADPDRVTGDVMVLEVGEDEDKAIQDISAVFERTSKGTVVVVMGRINSIPFNERLLDGGVSDYVLLPAQPSYFISKLGRLFAQDERGMDGRGKVVSVMGSKGGVGSSTVAQNTAWALQARTGRPVTLVDLDLHFGTVTINLNQDPRAGLRDALQRTLADQMDGASLERMYTKDIDGSPNLWMLASSPNLSDDMGMMTEAEVVQALIDLAATQASYVVLDVPQVWNRTTIALMAMSNESLVVSDHSIQGLRNADLMFKALNPMRPQNTFTRYVLNHGGLAPQADLAVKDFEETLGMAPAAVIPWNPKVFRAASTEGRLLGTVPGNAKVFAPFDNLARVLSGGVETKKPAAGAGFLSRLFGGKSKSKA